MLNFFSFWGYFEGTDNNFLIYLGKILDFLKAIF